MKRARLEDASLAFYLRNHVLSKDFYIELEKMNLLSDGPGVYKIQYPPALPFSPIERGRGLFYYDKITTIAGDIVDDTEEQEDLIKVFDAGNILIPSSDYTLDYKKGRVLNPSGATPVTITYQFPQIAVLDAYHDTRETDKISLPFVAVDSNGQDPKDGLELGGGKITERIVRIHVYANNTAERDDIVQTIMEGLEDHCAKLIDFNSNGFPLDFDGTFNQNFSPQQLAGSSRIFFERVSYRDIPGTRDFTYGERYKSIINVRMRVYNSRDSV